MNELATVQPAQLTQADLVTLKNTLCRGASDADMKLFALVCQRTQLDPFARQIYWIPGKGAIISIDGQRIISERSGKYEGMTDALWCGEDGVWKDVWLSSKPPAACKIGVYRKGAREAITAIATWQGYAQGGPQWMKNGPNMLAKCTESLARRKAFPQELSGLYTEDEMGAEPQGSIYDEPPLRITEQARGESNTNSPQYKPPAKREPAGPVTCDLPPIDADFDDLPVNDSREDPDGRQTVDWGNLPAGTQHVSQVLAALPEGIDSAQVVGGNEFVIGKPDGSKGGVKFVVESARGREELFYYNLANAQKRSGLDAPWKYRGEITFRRTKEKSAGKWDIDTLGFVGMEVQP